MLHFAIVRQDGCRHPVQFFIATDLEERLQEARAQPEALPLIADDQGELGFVRVVRFAKAANANNAPVENVAVPPLTKISADPPAASPPVVTPAPPDPAAPTNRFAALRLPDTSA